MGLLPDTLNCGLCMRRECRECFPRHQLQRKPLVSNPSMHHDTCVTHVPWCMLGSLTRGGGENVPRIPGACATHNVIIWQEAHSLGFSTGPSVWSTIPQMLGVYNLWRCIVGRRREDSGSRTSLTLGSVFNLRPGISVYRNPCYDWERS